MKRMYNEKQKVEVHIGMGLPGSGKTTYFHMIAPEHGIVDKDGTYKTTIDLDCIMSNSRDKSYVTVNGQLDMKKLFGYATSIGQDNNIICIDSLCLTKDTAMWYMRQLSALSGDSPIQMFNNDYYVIIDQWREDRDRCLDNDLLRDRDNKASYTIANAPYEPWTSQEELEHDVAAAGLQLASVKLVWHDVPVPEKWQEFTQRPGNPDDENVRYMRSQSWSLGGTWGSYTGEVSTVSPDEPKENEELDKFLEEHAPGISYLQYKKIVKECVTLETTEYNDYYGGTTHEQYWKTDMLRLYEMLKEMNLLNE